jgi:hypothetical protein
VNQMDMTEFQQQVSNWMVDCFGPTIPYDKMERNYRFLEEALELTQACGLSKADAIKLVDYVYERPKGEVGQEIGCVMVTLAALCEAQNQDINYCAQHELKRIWRNIEIIRQKQASKTIKTGPLP